MKSHAKGNQQKASTADCEIIEAISTPPAAAWDVEVKTEGIKSEDEETIVISSDEEEEEQDDLHLFLDDSFSENQEGSRQVQNLLHQEELGGQFNWIYFFHNLQFQGGGWGGDQGGNNKAPNRGCTKHTSI